MNIRNHIAAAGAIAVLAALAILYLVLPSNSWTPATVVSAIAVALSLGAVIYLPSVFAPASKTQAARLAGVGPLGATVAITLLLSIVALLLSLIGAASAAWAVLVVALAAFIIGNLTTNVARKMVDDVQTTQAKDERYRNWTIALTRIAVEISDADAKLLCTKIAEELRYVPSARATDAKDEASQVSSAISALQASVPNGDATDIVLKLNRLQAALSAHSSALIVLRSYA
ncbi:hypothetical protein M3I54_31835 [Paraburkholderia sp. CNPSo 3274]|uniref:hypothetical protein n=1 Tax=Paraburkholderia sp. CNPSo 3274 TaxID=2940932 RepID=UPI0020B6A7B5|nr:hypothetical protein [Paraburkholderia sp. CNPSo 3274]MCP3711502.1 hypothetical protein [Paraburkholderia sp. CNPSo 3274]